MTFIEVHLTSIDGDDDNDEDVNDNDKDDDDDDDLMITTLERDKSSQNLLESKQKDVISLGIPLILKILQANETCQPWFRFLPSAQNVVNDFQAEQFWLGY